MIQLLVIADDFTGALDTAAQFTKDGIATLITTFSLMDRQSGDDADAEVLVVDTESRHIGKAEAANRVKQVLAGYRCKYVYKKTDSTLRGNVGAELIAAMEGYPQDELVFIPAYPRMSRVIRDGYLFLDGVPLHQTAFAKDPLDPVGESYLPALIGKQADPGTEVICCKDPDEITAGRFAKKKIYILDGENDSDLLRIGQKLKESGKLKLTAGCAGFAEVLSRMLDLNRTPTGATLPHGGNTLIICGSVHENSIRQIQFAEGQGFPGITLTPYQLLDEKYAESEGYRELVREIQINLQRSGQFILKSINHRDELGDYINFGQLVGIAREEVSLYLAYNFGKLVKRIAALRCFENMVVFGGDTAIGIMDSLGCLGLQVKAEIMPGVIISKATTNLGRFNLVTKAGGFGDEAILTKVIQYLKGA